MMGIDQTLDLEYHTRISYTVLFVKHQRFAVVLYNSYLCSKKNMKWLGLPVCYQNTCGLLYYSSLCNCTVGDFCFTAEASYIKVDVGQQCIMVTTIKFNASYNKILTPTNHNIYYNSCTGVC